MKSNHNKSKMNRKEIKLRRKTSKYEYIFAYAFSKCLLTDYIAYAVIHAHKNTKAIQRVLLKPYIEKF